MGCKAPHMRPSPSQFSHSKATRSSHTTSSPQQPPQQTPQQPSQESPQQHKIEKMPVDPSMSNPTSSSNLSQSNTKMKKRNRMANSEKSNDAVMAKKIVQQGIKITLGVVLVALPLIIGLCMFLWKRQKDQMKMMEELKLTHRKHLRNNSSVSTNSPPTQAIMQQIHQPLREVTELIQGVITRQNEMADQMTTRLYHLEKRNSLKKKPSMQHSNAKQQPYIYPPHGQPNVDRNNFYQPPLNVINKTSTPSKSSHQRYNDLEPSFINMNGTHSHPYNSLSSDSSHVAPLTTSAASSSSSSLRHDAQYETCLQPPFQHAPHNNHNRLHDVTVRIPKAIQSGAMRVIMHTMTHAPAFNTDSSSELSNPTTMYFDQCNLFADGSFESEPNHFPFHLNEIVQYDFDAQHVMVLKSHDHFYQLYPFRDTQAWYHCIIDMMKRLHLASSFSSSSSQPLSTGTINHSPHDPTLQIHSVQQQNNNLYPYLAMKPDDKRNEPSSQAASSQSSFMTNHYAKQQVHMHESVSTMNPGQSTKLTTSTVNSSSLNNPASHTNFRSSMQIPNHIHPSFSSPNSTSDHHANLVDGFKKNSSFFVNHPPQTNPSHPIHSDHDSINITQKHVHSDDVDSISSTSMKLDLSQPLTHAHHVDDDHMTRITMNDPDYQLFDILQQEKQQKQAYEENQPLNNSNQSNDLPSFDSTTMNQSLWLEGDTIENIDAEQAYQLQYLDAHVSESLEATRATTLSSSSPTTISSSPPTTFSPSKGSLWVPDATIMDESSKVYPISNPSLVFMALEEVTQPSSARTLHAQSNDMLKEYENYDYNLNDDDDDTNDANNVDDTDVMLNHFAQTLLSSNFNSLKPIMHQTKRGPIVEELDDDPPVIQSISKTLTHPHTSLNDEKNNTNLHCESKNDGDDNDDDGSDYKSMNASIRPSSIQSTITISQNQIHASPSSQHPFNLSTTTTISDPNRYSLNTKTDTKHTHVSLATNEVYKSLLFEDLN